MRTCAGAIRRLAALGAGAALLLGVAACGGGGSTTSSATSAGSTAPASTSGAANVPQKYNGPEASLPTTYKQPKPGGDFTIGWLNPDATVESLAEMQKAATVQTEALGGKVIAKDDQLDPDKQVTDFNQLLTQGVDAIGVYPISPQALAPALKQAAKQGVPVVAIEATQSVDAPMTGFATQIWQGRDEQAFLAVKAMADLHPGGKITLIGIGAPVPALKYWAERVKYWSKQFGLDLLGEQDAATDDPSTGQTAMNNLIAKFGSFDGTIVFNDVIGLAAKSAARASGENDIDVVALNGSVAGLKGVEDGRLAADIQLNDVDIGKQAAYALWTLAGDPKAKLPKIVVAPPLGPITKDNVDQFHTLGEQLTSLKSKLGQ